MNLSFERSGSAFSEAEEAVPHAGPGHLILLQRPLVAIGRPSPSPVDHGGLDWATVRRQPFHGQFEVPVANWFLPSAKEGLGKPGKAWEDVNQFFQT